LNVLIAHVGSGIKCQVDCASSIILNIAESKPSKILPFSSTLLDMLDFVEEFQRSNAYKLGTAYVYLATAYSSEMAKEFYLKYKNWLETAITAENNIRVHLAIIGFLTLLQTLHKLGKII
jgi:hypothetical protein